MRLEIDGISARELRQIVRVAVEEATGPLREELDRLRLSRQVMNHREWADVVGVSEKTVRRWIEEGLPASKRARVWWIKREDIDQWLTMERAA